MHQRIANYFILLNSDMSYPAVDHRVALRTGNSSLILCILVNL